VDGNRRVTTRRDPTAQTTEERTKVQEMMNWEAWQQHREEMVREVELDRLAMALRTGRKTRGSRVFLLTWELRRTAGLLLKFAKTFKNPRKGTRT
jgi:hypothetical protein